MDSVDSIPTADPFSSLRLGKISVRGAESHSNTSKGNGNIPVGHLTATGSGTVNYDPIICVGLL